MRKPSKPGYHSLGALSLAIHKEIRISFPDILRLAGEKPEDWPEVGTEEHERLTRQIKSGLAFYCMEDFLWPNGRAKEPVDIWIGYTVRKSARFHRNPIANLFKLGEGELPALAEILWTPRQPNVQPVALRTYANALCYRRAGALLERRFLPLLTPQWRVREHLWERPRVTSEFHHRFRFMELFFLGDYPSRVAEGIGAEIRHVLKANNIEPHLPPSAAIKKAFQRQLTILQDAWGQTSDRRGRPGIEWVREQLMHPEYTDHVIEDGYADRYRKALLASLRQMKAH